MTIHSVVIQKLLTTNSHLGRKITTHHFKPFVYATRNNLSLIDSDKTLISLRNSLDFISHLIRNNARFLFVNTNPLFDDIFDHMTRKIGYPSFVSPQSQYWRLGGFLTNSSSPKKFRSRNKKICFAPAQPPDCVVILDFDKKSSVINEAAKLHIPIVGLVDSSVPLEVFQKITYPIPCNDSVQFVYTVCNLITKTFLLEQKNLDLRMGDDLGSEDDPVVEALPSVVDAAAMGLEEIATEGNQSVEVMEADSSAEDTEADSSAEDMEADPSPA